MVSNLKIGGFPMQIDVANGLKGFSYISYLYIGGIILFALIGMFVQFKMMPKARPKNSSTIILLASYEGGNTTILEQKEREEEEAGEEFSLDR